MSATSALVFLLIAASSSSLDIEIKLQNDPQCKFRGQQCSSDLRQIIYCTGKNGNSYVVTTCLGSRKCKKVSDGEYECSLSSPDSPDTVRNDTVFTCTGEGTYPDGYRCGVSYLCSKRGIYPELICECPPNSAITFYPKFSCTTNKGVLESCECPYKDRCRTSVSGGNFGENCYPGYYYICRGDGRGGFEPEVHKCKDGEVFVNGSCRVLPTSAVSTETTSTNIQPTCSTYYPPCFQEANVKCTARGELISHKIERCYYFCNGDLEPIPRDCGKGSIFICKNGQCGCILDPRH